MKIDKYMEKYTHLIQSQALLEELVGSRLDLSKLFLDRARVFLLLFHQSIDEMLSNWNHPRRFQLLAAQPEEAKVTRIVIRLAIKGNFLKPIRKIGRKTIYVPAFATAKYPFFDLFFDSEALQSALKIAKELANSDKRFKHPHFVLAALIQRGIISRADADDYFKGTDQNLYKFLKEHGQDLMLTQVAMQVLQNAVRSGQLVYLRNEAFALVDWTNIQSPLLRKMRIKANYHQSLVPNLRSIAEALAIPPDHEGRLIDPARAWLALFGSPEQQKALWFDPRRNRKLRDMPGYRHARAALRHLAEQTAEQTDEFKLHPSAKRGLRYTKAWWEKVISTAQALGGSPALTSAQMALLIAHEERMIDDDKLKSLWGASREEIRQAVGRAVLRQVSPLMVNVCNYGIIVRIAGSDGEARYTTPNALAQHPEWTEVRRIRLFSTIRKLILNQILTSSDRVITPDRLGEILRAERIGAQLDPLALRRYAVELLARLAHKNELVRVRRGAYMTPEDAQMHNIPALGSQKRLSAKQLLRLSDLRSEDAPVITAEKVAAHLKEKDPTLNDKQATKAAQVYLQRAFKEGSLLRLRKETYILPEDKARFPGAISSSERQRLKDLAFLLSFVPQGASPRVTVAHIALLQQAALGKADEAEVREKWDKLKDRSERRRYFNELGLKPADRALLYSTLNRMVSKGYLVKKGNMYQLPVETSPALAR